MKHNRSESGAAAVEFAMAIPVVALLCFAVLDYGRVVNIGTELRNAARAGAQFALAHPADSDGITWAAQHATKEASADVTVTLQTSSDGANNTLPYYCTCESGDPTAAAVNCVTGTCASGTKKFFVAVTTARTYTPLLPWPGLPTSIPLTGTAVMQVQ